MYDYPGKEDLQRFYRSCLAYDQNKPFLFKIEKWIFPVGIILSFGLFIGGMLYSMRSHAFYEPFTQLGILMFFGMMIFKFLALKQIKKIKKEESSIDFRSLERYKTAHKSMGFMYGRKYSYCLSGDSWAQVAKDSKKQWSSAWIAIMICSVFLCLGITYLATKNHPEMKDKAFEIVGGVCFMTIGCIMGLGNIMRPLIKRIQYGRKIKAVCVEVAVSRYDIGEDSSSTPVYMAEVDGKDYIYFGEILGNMQESMIGDTFTIYVNKKDPYQYACSPSFGTFLFGMVFLLSFGLIGAVSFIIGILA